MYISRLEHLKMIQAIITRMGQNSFNIKSWAVTLLAALLALAAADSDIRFALVAYVPIVIFWGLDSYFLHQERLFRKLYDRVRTGSGESDFSMNTSVVSSDEAKLHKVAFSVTLLTFYGAILLVILGAAVLVGT